MRWLLITGMKLLLHLLLILKLGTRAQNNDTMGHSADRMRFIT
eukprot:COSAG02_NODE_39972_length_410_cov_1.324759_1_plen_42_part_10